MEKVSLNNVQLDHLARSHPSLGPHFYGTVPCDRLEVRGPKWKESPIVLQSELWRLRLDVPDRSS